MTECRCADPLHEWDCPLEHSEKKPMVWTTYARMSGLREFVCTHGVGHPDPESVKRLNELTGDEGWGIHGCDGCCGRGDFPGNTGIDPAYEGTERGDI